MTGPLVVDLIDVSQYQSTDHVPWASLHAFGVKGVYAKATDWINGQAYPDPEYPKHRENAKLHGIPFGGYAFAHTDVDPVHQAEFFLNTAQPKPGDLRPALDLEINKAGLGIAALTNFRDAFLRTIGAHLHISSNVLYSPFDYLTTGNNILWRAGYSENNWYVPPASKPFKQWDMHQFSDGVYGNPQRLPGSSVNIDLTTFRKGFTIDMLRIPAPAQPGQTTTTKVTPITNQVKTTTSKWAPWDQKIQYRGVTLNQMTAHAFLEVERMVGRAFVFYRGSYTNGATSAGTDTGGGHGDISLVGIDDAEAERIVLALRIKGFAAYYRRAIPGYWPRHIHAILIGDPDLSAAAAKQVVEYKQGRNALANNGPDPDPRVHVISPYSYPPSAERIAQDEAYFHKYAQAA